MNILKSSLFYSASTAINKILILALNFYIIRILNINEVGHISLFLNITSLTNIINMYSYNELVQFELAHQRPKLSLNFNYIIFISILIFIFLNFVPELNIEIIFCISIYSLSFSLFEINNSVLRFKNYFLPFFISNFFLSLMTILGTLFLLNYIPEKAEVRIYGMTIAMTITAFFSTYMLIKNNTFDRVNNNQLNFNLPLTIVNIIGTILLTLDKFFLPYMFGIEKLAIYFTQFQICSIILYLASSFNHAIQPHIFAKAAKETTTFLQILKQLKINILILGFFSLFISIFGPLLVQVLTQKSIYIEINYFPFFSIGLFFLSLSNYAYQYLVIKNSVKNLMKYYLQCLIFYIGILLILGHFYGALGIAISFMISNILFFLLLYFKTSI
jgi:O-antigen/teichoic acid export membrane protein